MREQDATYPCGTGSGPYLLARIVPRMQPNSTKNHTITQNVAKPSTPAMMPSVIAAPVALATPATTAPMTKNAASISGTYTTQTSQPDLLRSWMRLIRIAIPGHTMMSWNRLGSTTNTTLPESDNRLSTIPMTVTGRKYFSQYCDREIRPDGEK